MRSVLFAFSSASRLLSVRSSSSRDSLFSTSTRIRESFLSFFEERGHVRLPSAPLVPSTDRTLLFTNAGMVPFKNIFLGHESFPYESQCATSSQWCIRAGGKHNDLDNVGYTARHHTLFEMLGNFSFGSYFRDDAIRFAWDFLTRELDLPKNRLFVTVHESDAETARSWKRITGTPDDRIRFGRDDNFWSMGDGPGPCGFCTEIYYDLGRPIDGEQFLEVWNLVLMDKDRLESGEFSALPKPCVDTGMGLERITSIVEGVSSNYETEMFSSIIRSIAHQASDNVGRDIALVPYIENPRDEDSIALRVIADHVRSISLLVSEGVFPSSVNRGYVVRRLIRRAMRYANRLGLNAPCLHSLLRAVVSNMPPSVIPKLYDRVDAVSEIVRNEEEIFLRHLIKGESLLIHALENAAKRGEQILDGKTAFRLFVSHGFPIDLIEHAVRDHGPKFGIKTVDLEAFDKYMQLQKQHDRDAQKARGGNALGVGTQLPDEVLGWRSRGYRSRFVGRETLRVDSVSILAYFEIPSSLEDQQSAWIALSESPFYPEGGGQVPDIGKLFVEHGSDMYELNVVDCQSVSDELSVCRVELARQHSDSVHGTGDEYEKHHLSSSSSDDTPVSNNSACVFPHLLDEDSVHEHTGEIVSSSSVDKDDLSPSQEPAQDSLWTPIFPGHEDISSANSGDVHNVSMRESDPVSVDIVFVLGNASHISAQVDVYHRSGSSIHHTATHLLHSALRFHLGHSECQAGSLVTPSRLRFDFTHPKPLSREIIHALEDFVNSAALVGKDVDTEILGLEEAKQSGALSMFSEKYADIVRVVSVSSFSRELCGGTHVSNTRELYPFFVLSETGLAAGTRRIEAVAGPSAVREMMHRSRIAFDVAQYLRSPLSEVMDRIRGLDANIDETRALHRQALDSLMDLTLRHASPKRMMLARHVLEKCGISQSVSQKIDVGVDVYSIPFSSLRLSDEHLKHVRLVLRSQLENPRDPSRVTLILFDREIYVGVPDALRSSLATSVEPEGNVSFASNPSKRSQKALAKQNRLLAAGQLANLIASHWNGQANGPAHYAVVHAPDAKSAVDGLSTLFHVEFSSIS